MFPHLVGKKSHKGMSTKKFEITRAHKIDIRILNQAFGHCIRVLYKRHYAMSKNSTEQKLTPSHLFRIV